jgi:hypothetical protein
MAGISTRTQLSGNTIADTDLFLISKDNGNGTFTSYKVTGSQMKLNYGGSAPRTNKIHVDAILGIDATGRGNIEKPYATVEYALANTTNTGTVTGTTTNGSATITSVSDTTNIKVGQYITGTNIPYDSVVVSKTSNTIVLSRTATGTGSSLTLTWWSIYEVILSGDFTATGNWFKAGFWISAGTSNISFGAFTLFNRASSVLIPDFLNGGNWYGTNSASKFQAAVGSSNDIFIEINNYYSIGTGTQLDLSQWYTSARNIYIKCYNFDCRFGNVGILRASNKVSIIGDFYGLLSGFAITCTSYTFDGNLETPASVTALSSSNKCVFNGRIIGQLNISGGGSFTGVINGTTHTISNGQYDPENYVFNAHIFGSINFSGESSRSSAFNGVTCDGGNLTNSGSLVIRTLNGNYTGTGSSRCYVISGGQYSWGAFFKDITLSGTSQLTIKNNPKLAGFTVYGQVPTVTVGSGCTLSIDEYSYGMLVNSGTVNINGIFDYETNMYYGSVPSNSGILNIIGTFNINRNGSEASTNSPTYAISTGTVIVNGGKVTCAKSDSKSGLFRKTASGGKLIFMGNATLKVANGLAPIQILSNTGTAQDILDFSVITNGASGFRLGDTFTDTTYGTAYAPNLLVNGDKKESTSYSW